ncbi:MAG: hypothetical protein HOO96_09590 [Polyangiaceae bacterium]|nr:hypothetical protein [Polyangiaceae bacterium]
MVKKSRDEIQGWEFDWLARDADGNVALLSTAGGGYAPEEFLRDTDLHDAAIREILALEPSTEAVFAPELAANLANTWRLVAERGLFAFDADPSGGPYRLVAAPRVPRPSSMLPPLAAAATARLVLEHVHFERPLPDVLKFR